MKLLFPVLVSALLFVSSPPLTGAESPAQEELKTLVDKIRSKLSGGQKTEAALADEIKEFDAIVARHKDQHAEDASRVLMMKAMLFLQVFDNTEQGIAIIRQVKDQFPESEAAEEADSTIKMVLAQEEGKKIQRSLAIGSKFPDFQVKDTSGEPLSIARFKGKVVLLDFWATWCGPCVVELPHVLKTYEKHHDAGFEIIGISLDSDKEKFGQFTQSRKMTWPQFFDGRGWKNELAVKYGVNSIPATYLLDGEGMILAKDLRGEQLEKEVSKALGKK
jgi:peroxiredoxin